MKQTEYNYYNRIKSLFYKENEEYNYCLFSKENNKFNNYFWLDSILQDNYVKHLNIVNKLINSNYNKEKKNKNLFEKINDMKLLLKKKIIYYIDIFYEFKKFILYHSDLFYKSLTHQLLKGPEHDEYNLKLINYKNNISVPICLLIISIVIVNSKFLFENFKYLGKIVIVFSIFYIAWSTKIFIKKLKNMFLLSKYIIEMTKDSQNIYEKLGFFIFGNLKLLFDNNFDHDKILKKFNEEVYKKNKEYYESNAFDSYFLQLVFPDFKKKHLMYYSQILNKYGLKN